MKLAELSDGHLLWDKPVARLDDVRETQFIKFAFVLAYCAERGISLLQAGDLFNRPRSWYLLPEVMDLLNRYKVMIYCVFGQHDTYMYSEKTRSATSLGILEKAGMVKILSRDPIHLKGDQAGAQSDVFLYGASYGQMLPVPEEGRAGINIGVLHAPIAAQALYPGQNYMDATAFIKEHVGYDMILCGDIHQKFMKVWKGRWIVNSGPMIRKEATAYNFQHHPGFFVYDTLSGDPPEWVEIPHAPAEQVLSRTHIEYEEEATTMLDEFVGSIVETDLSAEANFIDNLWLLVHQNNVPQSVVDLLSDITGGKK